jgi:hypothetical protein
MTGSTGGGFVLAAVFATEDSALVPKSFFGSLLGAASFGAMLPVLAERAFGVDGFVVFTDDMLPGDATGATLGGFDVRTPGGTLNLGGGPLRVVTGGVDVLCGGFVCGVVGVTAGGGAVGLFEVDVMLDAVFARPTLGVTLGGGVLGVGGRFGPRRFALDAVRVRMGAANEGGGVDGSGRGSEGRIEMLGGGGVGAGACAGGSGRVRAALTSAKSLVLSFCSLRGRKLMRSETT